MFVCKHWQVLAERRRPTGTTVWCKQTANRHGCVVQTDGQKARLCGANRRPTGTTVWCKQTANRHDCVVQTDGQQARLCGANRRSTGTAL